jgi:hypothetical protein
MAGSVAAFAAFLAAVPSSLLSQQGEPTASLLARFDNEHSLAEKERLLGVVTRQGAQAGPALLQLAKTTSYPDTRFMAMRGMATLHYMACAPFLETSLKDSDWMVRANAARALSDLRVTDAAAPLLEMFAAETQPGAVEQASLALRTLHVTAGAAEIRKKIPAFTGQTRVWLLHALGTLGDSADAPLIASYLDDQQSFLGATDALQELTGVNFGPHPMGIFAVPPARTLAAQAWWKAHKDSWPRCDDCHFQ